MKRLVALLMVVAVSVVAQDRQTWPRIMVVIDESIDAQPVATGTVATKIEEYFLEKGFRLVDKSQFEAVTARDIALAEGNRARAKEIGQRYGAELIIVGKSEASFEGEQELYGMKNFEYSAKGNAKVIITDTGEMIAVANKTARKPARGRAAAANLTMATLAEAIAKDLHFRVMVRLKEESTGPRILTMALLGIDAPTIAALEKSLPTDIPIIKSLKLRFLEKDGAVYEATVAGTVDDLRNEITAKRQDLVVIGATGTRIDVSTKEKAEAAKGSTTVTSPLEITDFKVENIFPSQVNYYAYNPLATIEVENSSNKEIRNVKVSIFIPDYMSLPSEEIVPRIDAGAKQIFRLAATLDAKRLYSLNANTTAQAKVELSYTFNNQPQTRSLVRPVTMYSKNTLSWRRGESVGSFITDTDEAVAAFSRFVIGSIGGTEALKSKLPRTVVNAMAVWNGIRAHGIAYVSDPWKSVEGDILDVIQYPRETLVSRTGDCDDSSVLLAACLENIGIRTILVGTSDHIFIMFDTELLPKNAYQLSLNEKDYVIHEGKVWMPLETTMITQPFVKAWKTGASEYYKNLAANTLELIDTRKAKEKFPPANLPATGRAVAPPPADRIVLLASQDLTDFEYDQSTMLASLTGQDATAQPPAQKNKAAILQAKSGAYDSAILTLNGVQTAAAYNTLGNIYLLKNELPVAQDFYQKSLAIDSSDGGVYLNFGLARYLSGSEQDAVEAFQVAISRFDSPEKAYEVLGLERMKETLGMRAAEVSERKVAKADIFDLLSKSLESVPEKGKATAQASRVREKYKNQENRFVFGGRRAADPTQISNVKEFLYWKE